MDSAPQSKYTAAGHTMAFIQVQNDVLVSKALQFDEVDGLSYTLSERGQPLPTRNMSRYIPNLNPYMDDLGLIKAAYTAMCRGQDYPWFELDLMVALLPGCLQVPRLEKDSHLETKWDWEIVRVLANDSLITAGLGPRWPEGENHGLTTMEWLIHCIEREIQNPKLIYRIWREVKTSWSIMNLMREASSGSLRRYSRKT
jgi:hypothetical protein